MVLLQPTFLSTIHFSVLRKQFPLSKQSQVSIARKGNLLELDIETVGDWLMVSPKTRKRFENCNQRFHEAGKSSDSKAGYTIDYDLEPRRSISHFRKATDRLEHTFRRR